MSRRKTRKDFTNPNTVRKLVNAGCGAGEGEEYLPWLHVQDVPSLGRSHRVPGWKVGGRTVHLLSNLELYFFYSLEWDPAVVDYREQFPLDIALTKQIAKQLNVDHPRTLPHPQSKESVADSEEGKLKAISMTSDFYVTVELDGKRSHRAYAIKPKSKLVGDRSGRVKEKLKIEELYWEALAVPWQLITEDELDTTLARNVEFVHDCYNLERYKALRPEMVDQVDTGLLPKLLAEEGCLSHLANICDQEQNLSPGASLVLAKHLIAHRRWPVDFTKPFNPCRPLHLLNPALAA